MPVVRRPGRPGAALPAPLRVTVTPALVATARARVLAPFAVTFLADEFMEGENVLEFPGGNSPERAEHVSFAAPVMTTSGTADARGEFRDIRRTVASDGVVASVFPTVTVAVLVAAPDT